MKRFFILFFILFTSIFSSEKDIHGKWITEKSKKGKQLLVEFYKKDDKYYGKILALVSDDYPLSNPYTGKEKLDSANPDKELQKRPLIGADFVSDFTYNPNKNQFENGVIYNPDNGKTYYCSISFKDNNNLIVKGSIDKMGWIGVKQNWKRIK